MLEQMKMLELTSWRFTFTEQQSLHTHVHMIPWKHFASVILHVTHFLLMQHM